MPTQPPPSLTNQAACRGQPHADENSRTDGARFCAHPFPWICSFNPRDLRQAERPAQGHAARKGWGRGRVARGLMWDPFLSAPPTAGLPEVLPPRGPCLTGSQVRPRRRPPGTWCGAPASVGKYVGPSRPGTAPPRSDAAASGPRWWPSWA